MDKHEEESYSFYFLKSKHLQKKCPDDAKVDITPKDLIKMIKEKSFNLNPSNYDLIDIVNLNRFIYSKKCHIKFI